MTDIGRTILRELKKVGKSIVGSARCLPKIAFKRNRSLFFGRCGWLIAWREGSYSKDVLEMKERLARFILGRTGNAQAHKSCILIE